MSLEHPSAGEESVLSTLFGALEQRVLERVWSLGEATVADVHQAFVESHAYTTVMTTLDRLYKKGALARRKQGRAFVYAAARSRSELERGIASRLLRALLHSGGTSAEPVLSSLVDAVSERDLDLLDKLERLVREKRKRAESQR
jgi:predicted transcriptional regulator